VQSLLGYKISIAKEISGSSLPVQWALLELADALGMSTCFSPVGAVPQVLVDGKTNLSGSQKQ
jgi:hypothetical protein